MAEQKLIRRKCDFCDTVQEFQEKGQEFSAAEMRAAENWITLVKLFFPLGQMYVVQKHACKQSCAKNILELGTLDLPAEIKQQVELESQRLAMQAAAQQEGAAQVGQA
jgi:hypothetical protein